MVTALSHKEVAYFKEMPKAKNNEINLFFFMQTLQSLQM